MIDMKRIEWGVFAVAVALAAMGCWFCWNCTMDWLYGPGQHFVFKRQVLWNAMGIALFAGASQLRWKWWRKSAPWLLVTWALLAFHAVTFGYAVKGSHRWVDLGFLRINVRTLFILVSALFTAWLCSKRCVRPWMVYLAVGLVVAFCGFRLLADANRMDRIVSFIASARAAPHLTWMQCQLKAAFGAANWFGNAGLSLRYLPNPLNDGMASASALVFGRWFPIAAFMLFAVLGGLLSLLWLRIRDSSGRMYVLLWGSGMVLPAVYGFFQCVGFVPVMGCSPVLAGYGGTSVTVFWLGLGALFSMLREDEGRSAGRRSVVGVCVWCGIVAAFFAGVAEASKTPLKFAEPPQKMSGMMENAFNVAVSEAGVDLGGVCVAGAVTATLLPEGRRFLIQPIFFNSIYTRQLRSAERRGTPVNIGQGRI